MYLCTVARKPIGVKRAGFLYEKRRFRTPVVVY